MLCYLVYMFSTEMKLLTGKVEYSCNMYHNNTIVLTFEHATGWTKIGIPLNGKNRVLN